MGPNLKKMKNHFWNGRKGNLSLLTKQIRPNKVHQFITNYYSIEILCSLKSLFIRQIKILKFFLIFHCEEDIQKKSPQKIPETAPQKQSMICLHICIRKFELNKRCQILFSQYFP